MLGLIGSIPFIENIVPAELISNFGIMGVFGVIGIILIILIIALIFVNKVGKVTKKVITAHKENKTAKKEKRVRTRSLRESNIVAPVQVLKDDLLENREIEIGLKGSDDKIEVVSGLEIGEKVIIK